jgi:hypothetical protein
MEEMMSIASPEETPGAAWPCSSKAGTPPKPETLAGALEPPSLAKAENGAN